MLKKRLTAILELIDDCECVADIGSDHGWLSVEIAQKGKAKTVIATDISAKSLQKTIDLAKKRGVSHIVKTLVGDGLRPILANNIKPDLAVIAGMGGREIIQIIEQAPNFIKNYIISPQRDQYFVRQKLVELGFFIANDFVILDNSKFYDIIKISNNGQENKLTQKELKWGKDNLSGNNPDFNLYINTLISRYQKFSGNEKTDIILKELLEIKESLYP